MQFIGTVTEAVEIANRGVTIFFSESPNHLAQQSSLEVTITRPNGTSKAFAASREFARRLDAPGGEVIALLISGTSVSEVPVGSVVTIASASGA